MPLLENPIEQWYMKRNLGSCRGHEGVGFRVQRALSIPTPQRGPYVLGVGLPRCADVFRV